MFPLPTNKLPNPARMNNCDSALEVGQYEKPIFHIFKVRVKKMVYQIWDSPNKHVLSLKKVKQCRWKLRKSNFNMILSYVSEVKKTLTLAFLKFFLRYSLVTPSTSIEESLLAAFGELQLCQEEMLVFSPHSLDYTDVQVTGQDSDTGGSMEDRGISRVAAEHVGGDSFGSVKVDDIYSAVAKKGFFDNRNDESDNSIGNISRNKSTSESEVVETNTKAVSRQSYSEQQQKEEEPPTGSDHTPTAHTESEAYKKVSPRGRLDRNSRRHKTDLGLQTSEVQDYLLHIQNARESLADRRREILRRGQMARERSLSRDGRLKGPDERTSPSAAQTPHSNSSLVTKDSIAGASNDPADTIIRFHFQTGRRQSHTARSDIIDVPSQENHLSTCQGYHDRESQLSTKRCLTFRKHI